MYTKLAKYYDQIFKENPAEYQFVTECIRANDQRAMDLGCGTGKTALHLAKEGLITLGIDMNSTMIDYATHTNTHPNLLFKVWDITNIAALQEENIDVVTCFGNTLVHLPKIEVQKLMETLFKKMNNGGRLLIQIINYDRIFHYNIKQLPIVEDEELRFTRLYEYHEKESHILFTTQVEIKKEQKVLSDETILYPIRKKELIHYGINVGFQFVQAFGNFKKDGFNTNESYHLVIVFEKKSK